MARPTSLSGPGWSPTRRTTAGSPRPAPSAPPPRRLDPRRRPGGDLGADRLPRGELLPSAAPAGRRPREPAAAGVPASAWHRGGRGGVLPAGHGADQHGLAPRPRWAVPVARPAVARRAWPAALHHRERAGGRGLPEPGRPDRRP